MDTHPTNNYTTLEEIQVRKEQLSEAMMNDSEKIAALWNSVFKKQENATRGEYKDRNYYDYYNFCPIISNCLNFFQRASSLPALSGVLVPLCPP